jgi:putative peptidoglycan lipid II flippase
LAGPRGRKLTVGKLAVIGSIVAGALYEKGNFFLSAVAPLAFNTCYILGALLLANLFESFLPGWWNDWLADPRLTGLAVGVLLGGCFQILLQLRPVFSELKGFKFSFKPTLSPHIRQTLKLMGPAALAASTGPLNLVINTNFAAGVGEGAITWLVAAFRLLQLPVGIFGVAIGVVVLPAMSRALSKNNGVVDKEVRATMHEGLSMVLWLMAASAAFLISSSHDIISLLFQHGKFGASDVDATARALSAYAFGVIAYGSIKVLSSFYYAVERTRFAMYVAIACVFVNLAGNLLLVEPFGHVGLAMTTSLTLTMNGFLLLVGMRRYSMASMYFSLFKQLIFLLLLMVVVFLTQRFCLQEINTLEWPGFFDLKIRAFLNLLLTGVLTVAIFLGAASLLLRKSPLRLLKSTFSR